MNNAMEHSSATANIEAYIKTHDVKYVADDAVFINMATGDRHHGKDDIGRMLHYIYHVAFDAKATLDNYIVTDGKAMVEGYFIGKHISNFAGIEATNKDVKVPLCVTYDIENGLIKQARIYMQVNVMMEQLKA